MSPSVFVCVSNRVRGVFELYQILYQRMYMNDISLNKSNPTRIPLESRSNPARNVRMQWSISLLAPSMPPSGFVNECIRAWIRTGFEAYSNCIKYHIKGNISLNKSNPTRIPLESRSNPARNVRMQWSISLLAPSMPPSGFVICLHIFAHHFDHKKMLNIFMSSINLK